MATRNRKEKCLGAIAANGLNAISSNQNSVGLGAMAANGPAQESSIKELVLAQW
jgi:hypothetical protein